MSRLVDGSFTGFLPALIERSFPDLYTVYAAGDDVLVIGPWYLAMRFALGMRRKLRSSVGKGDRHERDKTHCWRMAHLSLPEQPRQLLRRIPRHGWIWNRPRSWSASAGRRATASCRNLPSRSPRLLRLYYPLWSRLGRLRLIVPIRARRRLSRFFPGGG